MSQSVKRNQPHQHTTLRLGNRNLLWNVEIALTNRPLCLHLHLSNTAHSKEKLCGHKQTPVHIKGRLIFDFEICKRDQTTHHNGVALLHVKNVILSSSISADTKDLGWRTKKIMQSFPDPLPSDRYYHSCITHPFTNIMLGLNSSVKKI